MGVGGVGIWAAIFVACIGGWIVGLSRGNAATRYTRERTRLYWRITLAETLAAWEWEANQGDGIDSGGWDRFVNGLDLLGITVVPFDALDRYAVVDFDHPQFKEIRPRSPRTPPERYRLSPTWAQFIGAERAQLAEHEAALFQDGTYRRVFRRRTPAKGDRVSYRPKDTDGVAFLGVGTVISADAVHSLVDWETTAPRSHHSHDDLMVIATADQVGPQRRRRG